MTAAQYQFLNLFLSGPMLRADAVAIFCGEDGRARARMTLELFRQQAAPVVLLLGGRHEPPAIEGAAAMANYLIGEGGVAPERIMTETGSQNTHEQAEQLVAAATLGNWHRILLVASAYHLPRAWLSVLASLQRAGRAEDIHVLGMPTAPCNWWEAPPGVDRTRVELLMVESVKIAEYQAVGHCASYEAAVGYLQHWEAPRHDAP